MAVEHPDHIMHKFGLKISISKTFESVLYADSFVDKTLLLLALFEFDVVPKILATAPHLFGKSVNLDMVHRFLELEVDDNGKEKPLDEKSNYKLFRVKELNIMKPQHHEFVATHFGKYPVIKVNFFWPVIGRISDMGEAVDFFKKVVHEAFDCHRYLYKSEDSPLEDYEKETCRKWCTYPDYTTFACVDALNALKLLSKFLKTFFEKKVFVLIDEFDSIILRTDMVFLAILTARGKEFSKIILLWVKMIGNVMVGNDDNIAGGLITGVLDLNNKCTLIDCLTRFRFEGDNLFSDFYGFTKPEVQALFQKFSVDENLQKKAPFLFGGYYRDTYNPYSVVRYLHDSTARKYCPTSVVSQRLLYFFAIAGNLLEILLNDEPLSASIDALTTFDLMHMHSKHTVSSDFMAAILQCEGYLTRSNSSQHGERSQLIIPNLEAKYFFKKILLDHLTSSLKNQLVQVPKRCSELLKNLISDVDQDQEKFTDTLQMLLNDVNYFVTADYHGTPVPKTCVKNALTVIAVETDLFWEDQIRYDENLKEETDLYFKMFARGECFSRFPPPLSFLIGIHVSFTYRTASIHCIHNKDILGVLGDFKAEDLCAEDLLHKALRAKAEENAQYTYEQLNTNVIKVSRII